MVIAIGVDAHKDKLAACVVDGTGRALGERTFSDDPGAHGAMLAWTRGIGEERRFGIEGAGGFGAGLVGSAQAWPGPWRLQGRMCGRYRRC